MNNNSNNISKKGTDRQSNRSLENNYLRPILLVSRRKRSKSVSSISSKQSSFDDQLQKKINYRLSRQHVTFLIEEERVKENEIISKSESLRQYYSCFNNIFKIIYLTSSAVIKHSFYHKEQPLNLQKFQIVGTLIGDFQEQWTLSKTSKLFILSENIYQLSKNAGQFQKRIEFVCRKICMNRLKKQNIENAFISQKLKKFWQSLLQKQCFFEKNQFLEEMFLNDVQKLCFYDIYKFVNKCLCRAEFREMVVRWCKKEEIDEQTKLNFTFQFLLIEQFCLADGLQAEAKHKTQKQAKCCIM